MLNLSSKIGALATGRAGSLGRVWVDLNPSTICGVVYQNRQRRNACQFSFACEGRSLRVNESEAWRTAVRIAAEVTAGATYVSDVGGATHYHCELCLAALGQKPWENGCDRASSFL